MKLTESKLRSIIREELNVQTGTDSPRNSYNGYINRFVMDTAKRFASQLESAYEIDFENPVLIEKQFKAKFEIYNSRQDMFKQGLMMIYPANNEVYIEAYGGQSGYQSPVDQQKFLETTVGLDEDPSQAIDIVSSFQTLAGR